MYPSNTKKTHRYEFIKSQGSFIRAFGQSSFELRFVPSLVPSKLQFYTQMNFQGARQAVTTF